MSALTEYLRNLVAACFHKWVPWQQQTLLRNFDGKPCGLRIIHRCTKCGATRTETI